LLHCPGDSPDVKSGCSELVELNSLAFGTANIGVDVCLSK
jgi:hypothetical protein